MLQISEMNYQIFNKLKSIEDLIEKENRKNWMTLKEVCQFTKLSPSTIHRYILKGSLRVSKQTGKLLFKRAWIDKFLEG